MTDDPETQALALLDLAGRLARGEIDEEQYQGAIEALAGGDHAEDDVDE